MSINVSGHLTQDTTWSPDNNPYIVTAFLYVNPGVTLNIQPGVVVLSGAADCDTDWDGAFWYNGNEPLMKMIIVYGKIIALGIPENNIVFDRNSDNPTWRWGGICFMPGAPKSSFEYCHINNVLFSYPAPGDESQGALNVRNGGIHVRHCWFLDNDIAFNGEYLNESLLFYDCYFKLVQPLQYGYNPCYFTGSMSGSNKYMSLYACTFDGRSYTGGVSGIRYYETIFCKFINNAPDIIPPPGYLRTSQTVNSYGNVMIDSQGGFSTFVWDNADTTYCRRNTIINHYPDHPYSNNYGAEGNGGTVIIADNYGYGNVMIGSGDIDLADVQIYNNVIESTFVPMGLSPSNGEFYSTAKVFNNVIRSTGNIAPVIHFYDLPDISFTNNTFGSNTELIYGRSISSYTNNVTVAHGGIYPSWQGIGPEHEMFYTNCLSSALPDSVLNGGGNIIADPLFADTLALDFHLQAGSPCIDAGIVTDDMPAFDAEYNLRVVGDAPDMGAYEYGSVYIGGIQGYVYDSQTLQPLDCAQIKIAGKLPEFSDSLGCFPYPTGAGTYTVTVKRFDYADVVIPNVVVSVGDTTWLNIPMQTIVANNEQVIPVNNSKVSLYNYPNPFVSSTDINFILPEKGIVKLAVFNLKGQKVAGITEASLSKGHHIYTWDGKDVNRNACSSGIYVIKLMLDGKAVSSKKVTLVK